MPSIKGVEAYVAKTYNQYTAARLALDRFFMTWLPPDRVNEARGHLIVVTNLALDLGSMRRLLGDLRAMENREGDSQS